MAVDQGRQRAPAAAVQERPTVAEDQGRQRVGVARAAPTAKAVPVGVGSEACWAREVPARATGKVAARATGKVVAMVVATVVAQGQWRWLRGGLGGGARQWAVGGGGLGGKLGGDGLGGGRYREYRVTLLLAISSASLSSSTSSPVYEVSR